MSYLGQEKLRETGLDLGAREAARDEAGGGEALVGGGALKRLGLGSGG